MRRALYIVAVMLALVVALVLLAPILLKDRVVGLLLTQVNSRVDADVALESADVSLFADFPDLHLDARGLVVTGRAPFQGVELARVGHLGASVDLMSLFDGPARITALTLEDTTLDIRVNADGRANTDLTAPSESAPSEGGSTELWVRNVAISNLTVRYADATADTNVVIDKLNVTGDAEVADALVALRAKLDVPSVSVKDHGVELLRSVKIASDLDIRFAPETGALRLGDSTLNLNELALGFAGTVEPQAGGTALDLTFSADKTSFKGLLSLIPGAYTPDFGGVQADGALTVKGAVKGLLPDAGDSLPGLDVAIGVTDGRFQYPSLPAAVSDAQLDLVVHHPGGPPDALELDVKRFRLAVDGSPLEGRLSLRTPVSDPTIDTAVRGKLDLARLAAAFPDTLQGWTGLLAVDLQLAGKASAFSKGDVDAVRAGGTFALQNATLTDPTWPMPVTVEELTLAVDPRKLDLTAFRLRFGQSDLTASGGVENAIGWALADDVLVGRLDVKSTKLDLDPWSGGSSSDDSASSSGESRLVAVPKNLDLACSVDLAQVLYDGWDLRKVTGEARVKDGAIQLDDLRAETLGGAVSISGTYAAPTDAAADVDIRVTATDLLAADTVARMETLRKLLPGVSELKGRLRTGFGVQARLGPDLSPDLTTLASIGKLGGTGLTFAVPFLEPVARELGDSRMGNLALDDGDVGFQVQKGALKIDRMPITLGPAKGVLHGKTGVLDESLDLSLDLSLPTKALTGALKTTLPGGAPEKVDVTAKVGGTWKKPQVKVALGKALAAQVEGQVREAVGEVVDAALAQAEAKGDALVAEAEKQADRLRAEAKKQADALRKKADEQAKKLVKDAKGNPLKEAAAKEAAKAARGEADKAATKLEKEADKKGDELVDAAKKQKDKLIAAAKAAR